MLRLRKQMHAHTFRKYGLVHTFRKLLLARGEWWEKLATTTKPHFTLNLSIGSEKTLLILSNISKMSKLVKEVVVDVVAAMRIIKHCNDGAPALMAGSLLGLDVDGVLEITYSFAFPQNKGGDDADGGGEDGETGDYQLEMMRHLRNVNIDNNCVGWYQSIYMGTLFTNENVTYQYSYQTAEGLSENSIVIMYDPFQSKHGDIVLKAYGLTEKFLQMRRAAVNKFINPAEILEELPLSIRSAGHVTAAVVSLTDSLPEDVTRVTFENLSMSNVEAQGEKHMELLTSWMEDLLSEQQRFQHYAKSNNKLRQEHIRWINKRRQENMEARDNGDELQSLKIEDSGLKLMPELPSRSDHLLLVAQLDQYASQLNTLTANALQKLTVVSNLNQANSNM
ncbi:hypothetical protein EON65_20620 [archaeon]|nr:MAG: hypothetical protein EON65_20620 [archaeon]